MSIMQILGAFAKNLLEEDEKSRQGMFDAKEWLRRHRHEEKPASKKKKRIKDEDVARIANKVTKSVASHIDRMTRNRQGMTPPTMQYVTPTYFPNYNINPPFHNVNNPFWNRVRQRKFMQFCKNSVCPSCMAAYAPQSAPKSPHKKHKMNIKKAKKKSKEKKEKVKKVKETVVSVTRPVVTSPSENIVEKEPKKIWAKELLQEFREQAIQHEQKINEVTAEPPSKEPKVKVETIWKQPKRVKPSKLGKKLSRTSSKNNSLR